MTHTQTASDERHERAQNITILDSRRISDEVWEIDCINDRGEKRENMTIIPSRIYSPSKDVQHRGPKGVVGKYIRALSFEDDEAHEQLVEAIRERRDRVQAEMKDLREEDSNLLHAQAALNGL